MSEQEYLEMIVAERIQMILADMEGGAVMDGEEEWEKTLDGLEEAQRKAIEGYLDQTVFRQAATEKHLYLAGLKDGIRLLDDLAGELRAGVLQAVDQVGIVHQAGLVYLRVVFVREEDLVVLHLHTADLLIFRHGHKRAVVDLLDLPLAQPGHCQEVERQNHENDDGVIIHQRLFGAFHFIHVNASFILIKCVHFWDSCNVTLVYHNRKELSSE